MSRPTFLLVAALLAAGFAALAPSPAHACEESALNPTDQLATFVVECNELESAPDATNRTTSEVPAPNAITSLENEACHWVPDSNPPKSPSDSMWFRATNYSLERASQPDAMLMGWWCDERVDGVPGFKRWEIQVAEDGPATPPTGEELFRRVLSRLDIPTPIAHFGPEPEKVAVKVPVWIRITNDTSISGTESDRGLSVSVTAAMTSIDLGMGEPAAQETFDSRQPEATLHCENPSSSSAPNVSPLSGCTYTFTWRSTRERTNGTCEWPITVTANWEITWTASNGESGTVEMTRTSTTSLRVREWRTQLVSPHQYDREQHEKDQLDAPCI